MLDVTTNLNCMNNGAINSTASVSLDDDMDPLFDNDWLHEHNLDILFDLFEEEMESNGKASAGFQDSNTTNSSTIFGSSPVTSYLFGTSPSLASALDLYDLLYFDNQQPINTNNNNSTLQQSQASSSNAPTTTNQTNIQAIVTPTTATYNVTTTTTNPDNNTQKSQIVSTNHIANSITNAMRIKRRLKKGQNEGISLLARPNVSNMSARGNCGAGSSSSSCNLINSNNINNSDKTSTKLTNLKKTIISNCYSSGNIGDQKQISAGIDIINITKQSHHNRNKHHHHIQHHHHVHYITGCAVIREHAYAVRGH